MTDELMKRWIQRNGKALLKKKNVKGFSGILQPRIKNGRVVHGTQVIRIYVSKKEDEQRLSKNDLIPKALLTPTKDSEISTDVVEVGEIKALSDPKKRYRPMVGGISAIHKDATACTLGLMFKDNETGKVLVAQNCHCCANENKATIGDEILQPSPYDGGSLENDVVGNLYRFVPLNFTDYTCPFRQTFTKLARGLSKIFGVSQDLENRVDIGFFVPTVEVKQEILDKGTIEGKTIPSINDSVWKVGRTTGFTDNGVVTDLDYNGTVQYSRGVAFFTDCILVEGNGFSDGGDSTSFTQKGDKTIGSLFAGSDTFSVICKIDNIEDEGDVKLI